MGKIQWAIQWSLYPHTAEQVRSRIRVHRGAVKFDLRIFKLQFKPGGQFPRDAYMRLAIRSVGRDLNVKHRVPIRQNLIDRRAQLRTACQYQYSGMILTHAKFIGGTQHAVRRLTPDF